MSSINMNPMAGISAADVQGMDLETLMMAVQSNRAQLLEAQLKDSQQKAQLFEAVIDVLRRDYGVRIVKKPSGKPCKSDSSKD